MSKKVIAVVGAGGKTTYIKNEAEKYVKQGLKVLVTTTTHMYAEKVTGYIMAGTPCGEKITALPKELYERACKNADIVLVEADGSKHLPIKFPAEHEPVIPENVDEIVIICGLHALGKPLKEVAHRLELVKKCLDETEDTIVQPHHIQRLVEKGYKEQMGKKYPDKNVIVKAVHDSTLYQRVIAKLIEAGVDTTIIKEEWFQTQPELFVCGGGHVSYDLVKMASCLDFKITVMDDREEFANKERFYMADEVICDSFESLEKYLVKDAYYVVVTRGHKNDFDCVSSILNSRYQYLGMIGSRAKVKTTFDNLKNAEFSEELIQTVHAPIGLNIGAKTPAEIAVSILAEIIQVKNQKAASFVSRELSVIKEQGVLCIIIEKTGSAPRGEGSMMFVTDEKIIDTIGGGAIEFAAINDARVIKEVTVKEYSLNNREAQDLGMICGGKNKVLFIPF